MDTFLYTGFAFKVIGRCSNTQTPLNQAKLP